MRTKQLLCGLILVFSTMSGCATLSDPQSISPELKQLGLQAIIQVATYEAARGDVGRIQAVNDVLRGITEHMEPGGDVWVTGRAIIMNEVKPVYQTMALMLFGIVQAEVQAYERQDPRNVDPHVVLGYLRAARLGITIGLEQAIKELD